MRLWHGEGCAGGHVLFLWGIENGLCSTRGGNVREICLTEKADSRHTTKVIDLEALGLRYSVFVVEDLEEVMRDVECEEIPSPKK